MPSEPYDDVTVADVLNRLYAMRDIHDPKEQKWYDYDIEIQMLKYDTQQIRELKARRNACR